MKDNLGEAVMTDEGMCNIKVKLTSLSFFISILGKLIDGRCCH